MKGAMNIEHSSNNSINQQVLSIHTFQALSIFTLGSKYLSQFRTYINQVQLQAFHTGVTNQIS